MPIRQNETLGGDDRASHRPGPEAGPWAFNAALLLDHSSKSDKPTATEFETLGPVYSFPQSALATAARQSKDAVTVLGPFVKVAENEARSSREAGGPKDAS